MGDRGIMFLRYDDFFINYDFEFVKVSKIFLKFMLLSLIDN
jgi:hypothetical protein